MKTWFTPDGFIGDDPSSKRNARVLAVELFFLIFVAVFLLYAATHN